LAKRWLPKPSPQIADGLILFDGVCVLCSGWVRFVIGRDAAGLFRFVPIQSPYGQTLAALFEIDRENPETNAVVMSGHAYFKLDAAIIVLGRLPGWSWVRVLPVLPRGLRDWLYDRIAKNRYRVFGKTETCLVPTAETSRRFLFDEPTAG
jgi:predicted DCC family thiol-disulfide oxidoreductase YuxK